MASKHKLHATDPSDGTPLPQKYDPADFIVAPADAKGVSYRLTFRVPPDMEKSIDAILASNHFPFSTRGEVLRWTTHQGVKLLESMEPVASVTKRVDILTSLLNEEAAHSEFLSIFNHLEESISRYMADQAPGQASRVVAMARHQFETMPEGHWRDRYLEELDKRFSYLLKKAGIQLPDTHTSPAPVPQSGKSTASSSQTPIPYSLAAKGHTS